MSRLEDMRAQRLQQEQEADRNKALNKILPSKTLAATSAHDTIEHMAQQIERQINKDGVPEPYQEGYSYEQLEEDLDTLYKVDALMEEVGRFYETVNSAKRAYEQNDSKVECMSNNDKRTFAGLAQRGYDIAQAAVRLSKGLTPEFKEALFTGTNQLRINVSDDPYNRTQYDKDTKFEAYLVEETLQKFSNVGILKKTTSKTNADNALQYSVTEPNYYPHESTNITYTFSPLEPGSRAEKAADGLHSRVERVTELLTASDPRAEIDKAVEAELTKNR